MFNCSSIFCVFCEFLVFLLLYRKSIISETFFYRYISLYYNKSVLLFSISIFNSSYVFLSLNFIPNLDEITISYGYSYPFYLSPIYTPLSS